MKPYYEDDLVQLWHGDCLQVMPGLADASVDSVVTDPPYGLEFMGKDWDSFKVGRAAKYAKGGDLDIEGMAAQSGKGGAGPTYVSRPAKRCEVCGKQAWSGSPCVYPEPQWTLDNSPLHAYQNWCTAWARECLRILKPGGFLLSFGGTRTFHRMAVAIEDAGFEIRDSIAWLYGSGFPKSLDVSKAMDSAAGAERGIIGKSARHVSGKANQRTIGLTGSSTFAETIGMGAHLTAPATDAARAWQGWGTALKPAFEPIVVARKPLVGTVAQNVQQHGTGALNIDGCRVEYTPSEQPSQSEWNGKGSTGSGSDHAGQFSAGLRAAYARGEIPVPSGRWPPNVVLDESQAQELDRQSGTLTSHGGVAPTRTGRSAWFSGDEGRAGDTVYSQDIGGASRFFKVFPTFRYEAKAPQSERPRVDGISHATVKPLELMRYLVRLVTPPGGLILEPFAGSGTTVEAALRENFRCIAIEREAAYLPLIMERVRKPFDMVFDFEEPA